MTPTKFPECNRTCVGEACGDLPVLMTDGTIVSCWRMTWWERLRVLLTGRVWLSVWGGGQPPVCIGTEKPFQEAPSPGQPDMDV